MVLRFLCFVVRQCYLYPVDIVQRFEVDTTPMEHMPCLHQFNYEALTGNSLARFMGWMEFTRKYVLLSEMLFEYQYYSIADYFLYFELFFPHIRCFYFDSFISSIAWDCFVRSLPFLDYVHLTSLKASPLHTSPSQLRSLLAQLHSFSLTHSSLHFLPSDRFSLYG